MAQNFRDHFRKSMAFLEGNKLFAGDFRANLDETNIDMVQLQRDGTGNGLSNTKDIFCRTFAATNVSSAPKYKHLQGWSLKFT